MTQPLVPTCIIIVCVRVNEYINSNVFSRDVGFIHRQSVYYVGTILFWFFVTTLRSSSNRKKTYTLHKQPCLSRLGLV